jgi:hypothetical protein
VQYVHATYGIFVNLAAGAKVAAGETLEVVKDGKVVATLTVDRITPPDKTYLNGCAVCKAASGEAKEGQSVRKAKP